MCRFCNAAPETPSHMGQCAKAVLLTVRNGLAPTLDRNLLQQRGGNVFVVFEDGVTKVPDNFLEKLPVQRLVVGHALLGTTSSATAPP